MAENEFSSSSSLGLHNTRCYSLKLPSPKVADPAGTPHTTLLDSSRSSRCCNVYIAARKISVALSLDGLMCLARDSPALSVSDPSRTLAALYCSFRRHRRRQRSLHHMGP
ncbi:hypothetical protein KL950_004364 [Ogataea haglerorum]|nr:hypothetical protein KL950_004364 [Ogataea haglerorum]KAG7736153.1 hypothetical protein KL923_004862 [Ogataea haglerorum]KAG7780681.1 hypothetical protein KL922_001032 [Ogataea haglerorum]KAG7805480.1 hypothetical protein KL924_004897 [Ogataea haglerorum]